MEEVLRDAFVAYQDCESTENFNRFEMLRLAYADVHGLEATQIFLSDLEEVGA